MVENISRYVEEKIQEQQRNAVMGIVTKVFEHTETDDDSNHEVNVQLVSREEEFRRIPVHTTRQSQVYVPQKGDFVEVGFMLGNTQRPYVANHAHSFQQRAPLARQGHWRHKFGDESPYVYLEAEPSDHEGTGKDPESNTLSNPPERFRIAVKEDGLSDPSARIELDTSDSDPVIRLVRGKEEDDADDMGLELDLGSGEFTLADGTEYGIESDGNGVVTIKTTDDDESQQMGIKFDFNDGTFKVGDGSGYGIESDGNGNFTWYAQDVEITDSGSITW